jgi:hypothetical protein
MFQQCETKELQLRTVVRCCTAVLALSVCFAAYAGSTAPSATPASPQVPAVLDGMLQVDATPAGVTPSSQYTVRLHHGGRSVNSFVYQVQNPGFLPDGRPSGISSSSTLEHATSWTSFSFAGSVTIEVTNSSPFTSARILPSHAQTIPIVRGNSVVCPGLPVTLLMKAVQEMREQFRCSLPFFLAM